MTDTMAHRYTAHYSQKQKKNLDRTEPEPTLRWSPIIHPLCKNAIPNCQLQLQVTFSDYYHIWSYGWRQSSVKRWPILILDAGIPPLFMASPERGQYLRVHFSWWMMGVIVTITTYCYWYTSSSEGGLLSWQGVLEMVTFMINSHYMYHSTN